MENENNDGFLKDHLPTLHSKKSTLPLAKLHPQFLPPRLALLNLEFSSDRVPFRARKTTLFGRDGEI